MTPNCKLQRSGCHRINGLAYRVMVSTPATWDPEKAYPVLFVLDGNENFATASDIAARRFALTR